MGKKTIYVAERERELWERAERFAADRRLPMSALVMAALEAYLAEHGDP
jgi:hypothetical protein